MPVILGVQTFNQIEKVYGKVEAQALLAQLATRVFFKPRKPDLAKMISDELGTLTQVDRDTDGRGGNSRRERGKALMTPRDLQTLPDGQIIVMTETTNPLRLPRFDYSSFPAPGIEPPLLKEHPLVEVAQLNQGALEAQAKSAKQRAEQESSFVDVKQELKNNVYEKKEETKVSEPKTPPASKPAIEFKTKRRNLNQENWDIPI